MPVVHDGGGSSKDDDGRGPGNYLEKITPKDLVMFSSSTRKQIAKTDFSYLGLEHDVDLKSDEELNKIRVWGLPFIRPTDPVPLAIWGGLASGALINVLRRRPIFSSLQLHAISGLFLGISAKIGYSLLDEWRKDRELVVWDYVKKHPQDFPEIFNPPKKYKDLLLPWNPTR